MNMDEFFRSVADAALAGRRSEVEGLVVMILLHTHRLKLRAGVLSDRPGVEELAAITQRHAAAVIAGASSSIGRWRWTWRWGCFAKWRSPMTTGALASEVLG